LPALRLTMSDGKPNEKPHYTGHRKRLRERFLKSGAESLPDYELLEMILFPAKPMGDVKPMAKALLAAFGSFGKVIIASPAELMKVDGVNEAAVVAIKTVKSAAERMLKEEIGGRAIIRSWTQLLDYCRLHIGHEKNEEFHILFLNNKLELIAHERQQHGTINHTPVYPREVVKRSLELGASSIILVHNHPSGDVTPSKADIDVTRQIIDAARPLGVEVHDHLIIGAKEHCSFKAKGLI
jgi:DNA repair protein RadC